MWPHNLYNDPNCTMSLKTSLINKPSNAQEHFRKKASKTSVLTYKCVCVFEEKFFSIVVVVFVRLSRSSPNSLTKAKDTLLASLTL